MGITGFTASIIYNNYERENILYKEILKSSGPNQEASLSLKRDQSYVRKFIILRTFQKPLII